VLVSNARSPGPSPDGGRLAYVAAGRPFDRLMVLDLATNDAHALVENSTEGYVYFSRPACHPTGAWWRSGPPADRT
jgi:hypothetical protein